MTFNTATNKNTNKIKEGNINISTWIQYEFKDGKIKCLNPNPTKELTEKEQLLETMNKISQAIENNRNKYISKYDELHGEGSYERYNCPLQNYYEDMIYEGDDEDYDEDEV